MSYWLLKTEPSTFGIDDLASSPRRTTRWDGVRNYQARNFIRDQVGRGDEAFLYHSSCEQPGVAGIVRVVKAAYPDPSAFDRHDDHYDAASTLELPRWYAFDVQLVRRFEQVITLDALRAHADSALAGLMILRAGNRLSVTPVDEAHWRFIVALSSPKR
jgi:predicted RNA-binding protein with PUA-like domain